MGSNIVPGCQQYVTLHPERESAETQEVSMIMCKRISHPFTWGQVLTICEMYPYASLFYGSIRRETVAFLGREYSDLPEDSLIIAESQHNGHGRQWGVLLVQRPGESGWEAIGEFGHDDLNDEYGQFVRTGEIAEAPVSLEESEEGPRPSGIRLGDIPHFCRCLDNFDPMKEFFGTAEILLRDIKYRYIA